MLNRTEIANLALSHLGVSLQVQDFATENSIQAKVIRRHYKISYEAFLEKHDWGFATGIAPLPLKEVLKVGVWGFRYGVPVDCVVLRDIAQDADFPRTVQYASQREKWQEIYTSNGPEILCNVRDAHGKYTMRISELASVPSFFGRGLAAQLAWDIAPELIQNNYPKVKAALLADVRREIESSIADDISRQPPMTDSQSPFVRARLG